MRDVERDSDAWANPGDALVCAKCSEMIAVFIKKAFLKQRPNVGMFHSDLAQGPWKSGDAMRCRGYGCGAQWYAPGGFTIRRRS